MSVSRTNIGKNGIDKKSATAGHFSRSTFFSTAVAGNSNFVLFTYTIFTTICVTSEFDNYQEKKCDLIQFSSKILQIFPKQINVTDSKSKV